MRAVMDSVGASKGGPSPEARPLSILVVEDDDDVRAAVAELLGSDGSRVLEAPNGAVALETMRKNGPIDVVLLDLWMPTMDGWSFRIHQRGDPALREVPVIVLTADDAPQARAIDADQIIRKPFDAEALGRTVRSVVADRRQLVGSATDLVAKAVELVSGAVSHEVANPLMILISSLESSRAAQLDRTLSPLAHASVDDLLGQCWRIADTLRTLRGLPYPLGHEDARVDLVHLLRSVVASAAAEPVTLRLESEPSLFVRGDPLFVRYAIMTALHHATEAFSGAAGPSQEPHVEVRAFQEEGRVIVQVDDRGPSIPAEEIDRVFSVEYTGRARAWSAGIRLWYVRRAIRDMRGAIEISNRSGVGVRCRLVFPA